MAAKPVWLADELVLGWKVTKNFEPQHWDQPNAKPGGHKLTDIVTTVPKTIAHHTVIIAQSGSGKSFFLGRLLEEILLKTRSRILILDQNSDFRKIGQAKPAKSWEEAQYDRGERKGFLADEPSQADFTGRWDKISKRLYSNKQEEHSEPRPLRLDWLKFPVELLSEEKAEERPDQLRHCHSFVNIVAVLASATENKEWLKDGAFRQCAQALCDRTASGVEENIIEELGKTFGTANEIAMAARPLSVGQRPGYVALPSQRQALADLFTERKRRAIRDRVLMYHRAATHRRFVLDPALRFYFSRAVELERSGLIDPNIQQTLASPDVRRVEVVDLPSISDSRHQKMAMCTFLEAEWQRARLEWEDALTKPNPEDDTRVPTFIVVEEAHNAMPADATTPIEKRLQEQFRRIAAEGRKYGLFLILVSQRPDKLDRMVMSECENRAVMKVGSSLILQKTCEVLGLDGVVPRTTQKVLDFDIGRAMLVGPWVVEEPALLVAAARRTQEGGRDLQPKFWARSEDGPNEANPQAPEPAKGI